ncbi:MAG: glycosyltransferase family A protein [Bacteroidota bacterium]
MNALQLILQTYLNKFSNTTKLINGAINNDCKQIIIIPSYYEPDLEKTLNSLSQCRATKHITEVIIVLNCSIEDKDAQLFHQTQKKELEQRFSKNNKLIFHFILVDNLPFKYAGVGLARKIGMDEAIRRFNELEYNGLLICLDGDCEVNNTYLTSLENFAIAPESYNTICLHFEHNLSEERDVTLKNGIIFYELFLRYYKECLSYCGFLYPYHTIGSSMAVKASIYCKAGGMNKRKAGEDFYFLSKIFPYGKIIELNTAIVYPSARISTRVPFGTGRAQQNFIEKKDEVYINYSFQSFKDLKLFLAIDFYKNSNVASAFPDSIKQFLIEVDFENKLQEIKNNTTTKEQFKKRFFDWFDGFMLLKYIHFSRDNHYPNNELLKEVGKLMVTDRTSLNLTSATEQLFQLRKNQIKNH